MNSTILDPRSPDNRNARSSHSPDSGLDHKIIIVGSGFSGLGAAYYLKKNGIHDFVILEKANDIGGVWRDNRYPGLAVDVATHAYCYDFEPWPEFSRTYAPQAEIFAYQKHVARKYGLEPHVRIGCSVCQAVFDESTNIWTIHLENDKVLRCRYILNATGFFTDVKFPDIQGIEDFVGKLIHPARWDHDYDIAGKAVSIIGTGATAIQLVPALAPLVRRLNVYQRTPIWVMPKGDRDFTDAERAAMRANPKIILNKRRKAHLQALLTWGLGFVRYKSFPGIYAQIERSFEKTLRKTVQSPELQEKLLPDYTFFCKRPAVSDDYWPSFNLPNVRLITDPIARIEKSGRVSAWAADSSPLEISPSGSCGTASGIGAAIDPMATDSTSGVGWSAALSITILLGR
jgi:cation diffusion facilitator CzcD-associated flavoprotein CzcO